MDMSHKLRKAVHLVLICEIVILLVLVVMQVFFFFTRDYFACNVVGLGCSLFAGSTITLAVISCIAKKVNDQEEIKEPEENPNKVATEAEIPSSSL